jgi:hypothetical protein
MDFEVIFAKKSLKIFYFTRFLNIYLPKMVIKGMKKDKLYSYIKCPMFRQVFPNIC